MTVPRKKNQPTRILSALLAAIMAAVCLLSLFGCSSKPGKAESDAYARLVNGGKKLSVRAPVNDDKRDVFLFAIDLWQSSDDIAELEPLAKAKVSASEARATVKLDGTDLSELVCKGFVFGMENEDGKTYHPVSSVYFITNPSEASLGGKKQDESELSGSFKGLVGTPSELMKLGATSTLVTVDLGKLLRETGGAGAHSFIFNGVSCHVDRDALDALDREIEAYTEAGISIYLEIVQTKASGEFGDRLRSIAFEGVSGASGYALNMKDRNGAAAITAALKLLAERYSGGEHGRVDSFIIGRTVNNYSKYYADPLTFEASVENYVRAVRMAYNQLLLHNPNGRVYISLGNNWTVSDTGGASAKDMLTAFANIAENEGDFYWQVCLEANASDASDSSIWDDSLAVNGNQFVSPANLAPVTTLLATSPYKCNGYTRNLVLNRFAIGGGNEEAQAASYAYAYYTAVGSGKVNALIYAKTTDQDGDSNRSGLYSAANGGFPAEKKLAEVFSAIDDESGKLDDYIGELIGDAWKNLRSAKSKSATRKTLDATPVQTTDKVELRPVFDFNGGDTFGFTPISADYAELRYDKNEECNVLHVSLTPRSVSDSAGAVSDELSANALKGANYLTLSVKADASAERARVTVRLSGFDNGGKEHVYTAESELSSGEWTELCYDVKSFIRLIDSDTLSISITASAATADGRVEGLSVSRIVAEAPDKTEFPMWIIWVAIGLAVAGGVAAFVVWFNKNYTFVRE